MGRVQKEWEDFRRDVIDEDTPDNQLAEMQIAFFAGVCYLLAITAHISELEEDQAAAKLHEIHEECEAFVERYRKLGTMADAPLT